MFAAHAAAAVSFTLATESGIAASRFTVDQSRVGVHTHTRAPRPAVAAGVLQLGATTHLALGQNTRLETIVPRAVSAGVHAVGSLDAPATSTPATKFLREAASTGAASAYPPDARKASDDRSESNAPQRNNIPLLFGGIALIGLVVHRRMAARKDLD